MKHFWKHHRFSQYNTFLVNIFHDLARVNKMFEKQLVQIY